MRERSQGKSILLLLSPALVFIALLFVYPFLNGIYLSLTNSAGNFTLANYAKFFLDPWELRTIWVTLYISLPITIINVLLAIPMAHYMRSGVKAEKIITFFLILPITLGVVLLSEGMLTYFGPRGWFNQLLVATHLSSATLELTHNYIGVVLSLFFQCFPFGFLMLYGYISGINPDLEKAARMLGANKRQIFLKVDLPLMAPGIAIAFIMNFAMSFSVFPSAVLLGEPSGPTRVMAYAAYEWAFEKFNFNMGSTISFIMAIIEILFIATALYIRGRIYRGSSIVGKG